MINSKTTSLLFVFLSFYILIAAQPGTLDITFDTDGLVTTDVGFELQDIGKAIAVQSDGKIVVAGYSTDNLIGNYYAIARYNPDGSLDNSFSVDGLASADFSTWSEANSIAIQQDGKILVGGINLTSNNNDFALVRYNTDGSQDFTFGTGGKVVTDIGGIFGSDNSYSISLQSDGKIILAGQSYNGLDMDFALARFNTDGSLDNTFSADGKATAGFVRSDDMCWASALQSDGKIVIAGGAYFETSGLDFALLRFNTDGTLDNSFDTDGMLLTDLGSDHEWFYSIAIQPDGKILATGFTNDGLVGNIALMRYNTDGSLDTSFGSGGIVTFVSGIGYAMALQSDGKILIAGATTDFALLRYNSDGSLDNSFSTDGIVVTDIGISSDIAYAVTIQSDGKIVAAGESYEQPYKVFAVARYISGLALGEVEFTMNPNNILIHPNPIRTEALLEYTLKNDEMISLELFDISGKLIQTFIAAEMRSQGKQRETIKFNDTLATGNYVLVLGNGIGRVGIKVVVD